MTTLISSVAASAPPTSASGLTSVTDTRVCAGAGVGGALFRVDGETDFVALSPPIFGFLECQQGWLKTNLRWELYFDQTGEAKMII